VAGHLHGGHGKAGAGFLVQEFREFSHFRQRRGVDADRLFATDDLEFRVQRFDTSAAIFELRGNGMLADGDTRAPGVELGVLGIRPEAMTERPPPSFKGKRLQLNFATQAESDTPTVVLFVNDVGLLHFSYRRYLENQLRERFGFQGNPLRIVLRQEKK